MMSKKFSSPTICTTVVAISVVFIFNFTHCQTPQVYQPPPEAYQPPKRICVYGRIYLNETRKCYPLNKQGPCGTMMIIESKEDNYDLAECRCKNFGNPYTGCDGRPTLFWPEQNRCYFMFDQGPCKSGEWLVADQDNKAICKRVPCGNDFKAPVDSQDWKTTDPFVFPHDNKCYSTRQQGPCQPNQLVYFRSNSFVHECKNVTQSCQGAYSVGYSGPNLCQGGSQPDSTGGCEPTVDY